MNTARRDRRLSGGRVNEDEKETTLVMVIGGTVLWLVALCA